MKRFRLLKGLNQLLDDLTNNEREEKMEDRELQERFNFVKDEFFPRWKDRNNWIIKIDKDLPCFGRCSTASKTIAFLDPPSNENEILAMIIHEICHAPKGCGGSHGKTWQNRMLNKSKRAKKKGMEALAARLVEEVRRYKEAIEMGAGTMDEIYSRIEEIVMDCPEISFDDCLEGVALEYGATKEELWLRSNGKIPKRAKEAFDRAKRLWGR